MARERKHSDTAATPTSRNRTIRRATPGSKWTTENRLNRSTRSRARYKRDATRGGPGSGRGGPGVRRDPGRRSWSSDPVLSAHAAGRRLARRPSEALETLRLHGELYGCPTLSGIEYSITIGVRTERREMVVAGLGRTARESQSPTTTWSISRIPPSTTRCATPRQSSGSSPPHRPAAGTAVVPLATMRSSSSPDAEH
jgi:hypothetical protein